MNMMTQYGTRPIYLGTSAELGNYARGRHLDMGFHRLSERNRTSAVLRTQWTNRESTRRTPGVSKVGLADTLTRFGNHPMCSDYNPRSYLTRFISSLSPLQAEFHD